MRAATLLFLCRCFPFPFEGNRATPSPPDSSGRKTQRAPRTRRRGEQLLETRGGVDGKRPLLRVNPPRAHTYARISHFLFFAFTLHRGAQRVDFNGKRGEALVLFLASPRVKAMVSAGEGVFTKVFTLIALWHSVL